MNSQERPHERTLDLSSSNNRNNLTPDNSNDEHLLSTSNPVSQLYFDPEFSANQIKEPQPGTSWATSKGIGKRPGSLTEISNMDLTVNFGKLNIHDGDETKRKQPSPFAELGLGGLRNIGNTCFMNSILQCLSNTKPLLDYILQEQYLLELNTTTSSMKGALMRAFGKLISDIWSTSKPYDVDTSNLKSQIQKFNPIFRGSHQHDSQELLRFLLEGLHCDVNRITQKATVKRPLQIDPALPINEQSTIAWRHYQRYDNSKISEIFVGQLKSTLKCLTCGHLSVTFDPFWDLSLSIPTNGKLSGQNPMKLEQCIQHFTQEEILDGNEKPMCEKCKVRRKCSKKFSIQKFPEVLVIHLKRFTSDNRGKLRTTVKFPISGLDMSHFGGTSHVSYNLYGISNHFGTTFSGHYIAYCRHPYTGEWSCYDDSRVTPVSEEILNNTEGYVLFYEMSLASKSIIDDE